MPAPVFGPSYGRWSIGSAVNVYWWERKPSPPGVLLVAAEEQSAAGQVVAITRGGPEGWIVTVSRGPLFDLLGKASGFNPSQIRAATTPVDAGEGGCSGCSGITLADPPNPGDV